VLSLRIDFFSNKDIAWQEINAVSEYIPGAAIIDRRSKKKNKKPVEANGIIESLINQVKRNEKHQRTP